MLRSIPLLAVLLIALLPIGSCKSPTAPEFHRRVSITHTFGVSGSGSVLFSATLNFDAGADARYVWLFDGKATIVSTGPEVKWTVNDTGLHHILLSVNRASDDATWATGEDTLDLRPWQMTSHLNSFEVDTFSATVLQRLVLKAPIRRGLQDPTALLWLIDGKQTSRPQTDTISCSFTTTGNHRVTVYLQDTASGLLLDSVKANVFVRYLPMTLSASSPIEVLRPATLTASFTTELPWEITWSYGDGFADTASTNQTQHSYMLAGSTLVTAILQSDGIVIARDSIEIVVLGQSALPLLTTLQSYTRAELRFQGRMRFDNDNSPCFAGLPGVGLAGISFTYTNLAWDGYQLSFRRDTSWYDSTSNYDRSGHSSGAALHAVLSRDLKRMDTVSSSQSSSDEGRWVASGGTPTDSWSSGSTSVTGLGLIFMWSTPDTVVYGLVGPTIADRVSILSHAQYRQSPAHGIPGCDITYQGTDWRSTNPMPAIILKLYR